MKTNKDEILEKALHLFASRGYEAVSTSQIAEALGITKGALYRHFENKEQIMKDIIARMYAMDAQQAQEDSVPVESIEENPEPYAKTSLHDFCIFASGQFAFWTEDPFASDFRKMLTIEQYRSREMQKIYQESIGSGPVKYSADILEELIKAGKVNEEAKAVGAYQLAIMLYAPLFLAISMADGGMDRNELQKYVTNCMDDFEKRWGI